MLVEDLIKQLQVLDPKLPVIASGYEGGYFDVKYVQAKKIALNVNDDWWYGPHDDFDCYDVENNPDAYSIINAIYLG